MEWSDAVVGALVGGLLTATGFIYKRRLDNISLLNKSLYQLLILYRSINSNNADSETPAKIMIEVINEVFPGSENDPSMKEAEQFYNGLAAELFASASTADEENLLPLYLDAVKNISAIDPVLAYRLSANAGLKLYLLAADKKAKEIREAAAADLSEKDMRFVNSCNKDASASLSNDVIRELRADLLILSLRCGIIPFLCVARRMLIRPGLSDSERSKLKAKIKVFFENAVRAHQAET